MGKKPNKKPGNPRGFDFYLNKVALVIFTVLAVFFVATAVSTQMLTPLLIAAVVAVAAIPVALVWWLSLRRTRPIYLVIGSVLAMVFCIVFAVGTRYIQIGMDALNQITQEEIETASMCVYVRADDTREMEDLLDETFGTLELDASTQAAVDQLGKEYSTTLTTQVFDSSSELVDALNDEDVDVILIDQGQLSLLEDLEGYETIEDSLRMVKSFHVEVESDNTPVPDDFDLDADSVFTVYISGSDSRDNNIMATGRSDVNIIASVNTKTRQVLLLNTPRDFYVPLARNKNKPNALEDKLTHAGIYGVDESKDTLALYYGIDIDYYFRVNFNGFEEIIDALDGIDVDSQYAFKSSIAPTPIYYKKGVNHLDGYEALYYVRERYSFVNGDYQRGVNQMQVIEAVMKKAMSPAILTSYTSMMQALSDCFRTSVPTDLISTLVRSQLSSGGDWNIVTYYVSGSGSSEYTYSIPSQRAYVTIPDESTVEIAKDLLQQVENGETISAPQQ